MNINNIIAWIYITGQYMILFMVPLSIEQLFYVFMLLAFALLFVCIDLTQKRTTC